MKDFRAEKVRWSADQEGTWLSFLVGNQAAARKYAENVERPQRVTVKEWREKRSLDANGYAWVLINALAQHYGVEPEEVYKQNIARIGGFEIFPVREDAAERWTHIWDSKGLGWFTRDLGPSKIQGYVNIACYYGSSVYDTKQMSTLIDRLVDDCKAVGIPTETPEELARMKEEWT